MRSCQSNTPPVSGPLPVDSVHRRVLPNPKMQRRCALAARAGYRCLLVCIATLVASAALAQVPEVADGPTKRPRVALVLAGGGAKGGAHIGVLKVLEELRVPVDCIAGTSMGALVGGGYASGMTASQIEAFVTHVDWKSVVGGAGSRPLQPVEQKRFEGNSGSLELGLKGSKVVPPSGLIASSRIEDVLRTYVASTRSVADFDKLPIPYRAVATDMLTGTMVVLGHGDIATAMRASMSIPGAFAPVVIDPYVLSDGFVVRNLPIDVARKLCGDVVIAVNIVKHTATAEELVGPASLVSRGNDIMMEANERLQLQTLTERDIRIDVDVGDVTAASFERTGETIPMGEKAARAVAPQLAALSMPPQEYLAWRRSVTLPRSGEIRVADVQFKGLEHVNPDYLRTLTKVHAGDTADIAAISADAARLAALDDLQGVSYHLSGDPDNPVLVWEPKEKQIGPNYLLPSLGLYAGGPGDLRLEVDVQYVRRWINSYGGQWRNRLEIGAVAGAETSLYQPLNFAQTFFVEPYAGIRRSLEDLYNKYNRVATYFYNDLEGRVEFGANLEPSSQIRLGYWADRRRIEVDTGVSLLPTGNFTDAGVAATVSHDSRDTSSYATKGTAAMLQYFQSDTSLGASRDWRTLEAAVRQVARIRATNVWITVAGGSDLGSTLPADRAFSLGGPQSFPGYAPGQVRARSYWTLQGDVLWRVADILSIANQALYAGFALEGGRVYDRIDPEPNSALYGISGYVGGRTPVGTLTIGVGKATGAWAGWITLGTPVGSGSIRDNPMFR
jgi:NTE family protein